MCVGLLKIYMGFNICEVGERKTKRWRVFCCNPEDNVDKKVAYGWNEVGCMFIIITEGEKFN